jgi:hypothetical protein
MSKLTKRFLPDLSLTRNLTYEELNENKRVIYDYNKKNNLIKTLKKYRKEEKMKLEKEK